MLRHSAYLGKRGEWVWPARAHCGYSITVMILIFFQQIICSEVNTMQHEAK